MTEVTPQPKQGKPPSKRFRGRARPGEALAWLCAAALPVCSGRPSERHHVLRRSQGGSDEAANTRDLCGRCHEFIHANPGWAYANGYLKRGVK